MMTAHSSSLAYESLPTEEGGTPHSHSFREADYSPSVSHHPIPTAEQSFRRSKVMTGVLVVLLLLASIVLGVVISLSARQHAYQKIFGPEVDTSITHSPPAGTNGRVGSEGGGSNAPTKEDKLNGYGGINAAGGNHGTNTVIRLTTPIIPTTSPPPPPTTTSTTSTTSTTTPTTTTPTTTTPTTTTPTTTTPTTTSTTTTTTSTTATTNTTPRPTTQKVTEPPTTLRPAVLDGSGSGSGQGAESGRTSTPTSEKDNSNDVNSHMRVVDYVVILQNKLSPGAAIGILVALVVACVAATVAIVCVVRRRNTARRRRAHVRRAINELRDQGKANLLQSDDEA
ncbi:cell wall integrity and stress response component 2-like [Hyalella azteca]|uniref:Cell wall integrity and stress response component 2-like n=1 Tax=Hyalella azteca TaxID=294128 RepID=A0A8B7P5Y5_HYAAZ|nr:cell wall integrity and stress response component 2-like [Hyalella azteca]